jgi:excisionase family DNA binding protein
MSNSVTAEELFTAVRNMPSTERVRFFSLLGANAFQQEDYSHEQVFGDLENDEFTAGEVAEYLEVSLPTFRRYVQSNKINPSRTVGRNQFFATKALKSFKRSLRDVKGLPTA